MQHSIEDITIQDETIRVFLYIEKRKQVRYSFTKKGLAIRLPHFLSRKEMKAQIDSGRHWGKKVLETNAQLLSRYSKRHYTFGHKVKTFDSVFTLKQCNAQNNLVLHGEAILLSDTQLAQLNPQSLSKLFAQKYNSFFQNRLAYWNQLISVQHNKLRLKYNSSNWGSCSSKGNINLSTRLILCPLPVIDYVMVHEICHFIHPNHSKAFWREVESILPDYKIYDDWLKENGGSIDF